MDNKRTVSSKLLCVSLEVVQSYKCDSNPNTICTISKDERNICSGDYGGPLYVIDAKGQTVVGIASYSKDIRGSATCQDGHSVSYVQIGGIMSFINEIVGGRLLKLRKEDSTNVTVVM